MHIRERLVGGWTLDAYEARDERGEAVYPFGKDPGGMIMWAENGAFSAQVSPGEPAGTEPRYVAYYGTWEVDEKAMEAVHTVTGANSQALIGTVQRRGLSFEEDCVILRPPPLPGAGGGTVTMWLRWKRLAR